MIKVFFDRKLPDVALTYLVYPNFKIQHKVGKGLFGDKIFKHFTEPVVSIAETAASADFILLPHNYSQVRDNQEFLSYYITLAKTNNKRLLIFSYGDVDYDIDVPQALIFKMSLFRFRKKKNEIKLPLFVEDMGETWGIEYGERKEEKPTVGFCGWADYSNVRQRARATFYHQLVNAKKLIYRKPELEATKQGIYFRKKILNILENSELVEPKFIRRTSFGLNQKTISLSPEQSRKEFVENIKQTDFSLAVRGDANDSARFYEIMSLGRIPVLLDTESVLPLEDAIEYSKCILRIPYQDIGNSPQIIADFYAKRTTESLMGMQEKAREVFEKYLRVDAYFTHVFNNPDKVSQL